MSTLQTLRERAGILVAVVIGLALLFFVIGDFFGNGQGNNVRAKHYYEIAHIGKETVSYQDYQARIEEISSIYEMSGTPVNTETMTENIQEQTWNQMLRDYIMNPEFEELGLAISSDELLDLVQGDEPHPIVKNLFTDPNTGMLNRAALANFLRGMNDDPTMKAYWLFFEDEITKDRINSKYNNLVAKGLYVPTAIAEMESDITNRSVDFSYVFRRTNEVADSLISLNESDLNKYYQKHKEEFDRPASRDIEYVVFAVIPSRQDSLETLERIEKEISNLAKAEDIPQFVNLTSDTRFQNRYYSTEEIADTLQEFVRQEDMQAVFGPWLDGNSYKIARLADVMARPDSVRARHILISPNQSRNMEMCKTLADSIVNELKQGKEFETLAVLYSDDTGSAQLGGDLGWFPEGMMVEAFSNACFSTSPERFQLVETQFGYHIIEVTNRSRSRTKYKLAIVDRSIEPSNETYQDIYSEATRFAGTNNTYEKFNQSVADQGLDKRIATDIRRDAKTLPGLPEPRELIRSAYEMEKADKIILDQNEQAVFEIEDLYIVAYLTHIQEEGIAPLDDVRSEIRLSVSNEKKADYLAEQLKKEMAEVSSLEELSSQNNLEIYDANNITFTTFSIPMGGMEPRVIASAISAEEGVLTGPVKGNNGVYVLTVNALNENPGASDPQSVRERMAIGLQSRAVFEAYEALKEKMNVKDMRYKFY